MLFIEIFVFSAALSGYVGIRVYLLMKKMEYNRLREDISF
jgi:hypothetical protein